MFLILAAIIVAGAVSWVLFLAGDKGYNARHTLAFLVGALGMIATGFSAVVYVFAGWYWIAAEYQAQVINREYDTNYTQAEVFYAINVIETVRQLDRKRNEITGDTRKP